MARIPLVAVSIASAAVLFVGTSAGILAVQGRLGALLGKGGDAAHADGGADSKPAHGAGASASSADPASGGAHASSAPASLGAADPNKTPDASERSGSQRHGNEATSISEIAPPKRIATASLVNHFTFPEAFSAKEMEELFESLKESQRSNASLSKDLAREKSANERDRADADARYAEVDAIRKQLEQEKTEVTAKVAELAKRSDRLAAGEDKFVKATVARLATLKPEEAKVQLLDLDDGLAARILQKMEPKSCAKMLAILPVDKRVALTKQLRALSTAEEEQAAAKGASESANTNK